MKHSKVSRTGCVLTPSGLLIWEETKWVHVIVGAALGEFSWGWAVEEGEGCRGRGEKESKAYRCIVVTDSVFSSLPHPSLSPIFFPPKSYFYTHLSLWDLVNEDSKKTLLALYGIKQMGAGRGLR